MDGNWFHCNGQCSSKGPLTHTDITSLSFYSSLLYIFDLCGGRWWCPAIDSSRPKESFSCLVAEIVVGVELWQYFKFR